MLYINSKPDPLGGNIASYGVRLLCQKGPAHEIRRVSREVFARIQVQNTRRRKKQRKIKITKRDQGAAKAQPLLSLAFFGKENTNVSADRGLLSDDKE
jgi:hypothetical protein